MILFIRKTIQFLLGFLLLFVLFFSALTYLNKQPYQQLYRFQLNKLKRENQAHNLFIGDSSLGNAIDAELFEELSGKGTLNVALTGLYGYAGSYNMLKRTYSEHPEIKNVIIMQALDMQTRKLSMAGYLRTIGSVSDFWELNIVDKKESILEVVPYLKSVSVVGIPKKNILANDYIKQKSQPEKSQFQIDISSDEIKNDKNKFLQKIVDYCSKNNLNLIYAHGPIYEKTLLTSEAYVKAANKRIEETGVLLLQSTPLSISEDEIGDTSDHVHPDYRSKYTRKYYELILAELVE